MRIALLGWESLHSISIGGVGVHVTELACALERNGHEVHVFTRMGRHDQAMYERIHGVHYHRVPFSTSHDFVDEINNMNAHEIHTVMTRVGENARVIIAGDEMQSDLGFSSNRNDKHEHAKFLATIRRIDSIHEFEFNQDDIVRSNFVKQWIIASMGN